MLSGEARALNCTLRGLYSGLQDSAVSPAASTVRPRHFVPGWP